MLATFAVLLLVSGISSEKTIDCDFFVNPSGDYTCFLSNLKIEEDEFNNITIAGNHLQNKNNSDVGILHLFSSEVPFVVTQIFETFPNLFFINITSVGLHRIQMNDFRNAGNLIELIVIRNPIVSLPTAAFAGAFNVRILRLFTCSIKYLDENAFVGLNRVTLLGLESNHIENLPLRVFRPLIRMRTVFLNGNRLTRIDGRIFQHNQYLHQIGFSANQIYAIGGQFLDFSPIIAVVDMTRNICSDRFLGFITREALRRGLVPCFESYELTEVQRRIQ
jgi:hypothetical protein